MGIVLHTLAALGYALLALRPWRALAQQGDTTATVYEKAGLPLVLILHGAALFVSMTSPQGLYLGLGLALSSTLWLGMIVFWLESMLADVGLLRLLLLPLAALAALMPAILDDRIMVAHAHNPWLKAHLILSLAAYGLMTVAALHALLTAAADNHLHSLKGAQHPADNVGVWQRLIESLPPLLTLEHLLFRLIGIGFVLLTLAVGSGSAMSISLTGQWLPFDHKTVFTLLSWVTFGLLLLGRHLRGWRGRLAVRYTLTGLVLLLLAYAGTRFVMEFLLSR